MTKTAASSIQWSYRVLPTFCQMSAGIFSRGRSNCKSFLQIVNMHSDGFVELARQSLLLTKTCVQSAECEYNCRENLIQNFYDSCNFEFGTKFVRGFEFAVYICFVFFIFSQMGTVEYSRCCKQSCNNTSHTFCNNISQIAIITDLAGSTPTGLWYINNFAAPSFAQFMHLSWREGM